MKISMELGREVGAQQIKVSIAVETNLEGVENFQQMALEMKRAAFACLGLTSQISERDLSPVDPVL